MRNFFLNYNPLPVVTTITYIPITWLDYGVAKVVWNMGTALLLIWSLRRLLTYLRIPLWQGLILIPVFFTPMRSSFAQGQAYVLLTALLIEGYLSFEKGNSWKAAFFWGFCILFKIFPAILLCFLFFEKDYRTLLRTIIVVVVGSALMIPLLGWDVWFNYHWYILPRIANGELNHTFTFYYQSMQVALRNMLVHDKMHNPNELVHLPWLYVIVNNLFKAIIVSIGAAAATGREQSSLQRFSIWFMAGLLINGYGTTYGLVSFIIPFTALVLIMSSPIRWWLVSVFFLFCNVPVDSFQNFPEWLQYPRLMLMLLAWGLIIYHMHLQWKPVHAALFLLILAPAFLYHAQIENDYALEKEEALLIYDFNLSAGKLSIKYFDMNGPQEKVIASPLIASESTSYPFTPHSLGNTKLPGEFIKKAVRINQKQVLYLSDKGRGPGFYSLRILELP
ncbi:MAG: DUF2029 domain-containing protein [Bacteroidia bacterium]|nr:DUF2029 domain-containing protein [Bacteroidia bacterium]